MLQKVGTERGWCEGLSGEPGKSGGPFGRGAVGEERGEYGGVGVGVAGGVTGVDVLVKVVLGGEGGRAGLRGPGIAVLAEEEGAGGTGRWG